MDDNQRQQEIDALSQAFKSGAVKQPQMPQADVSGLSKSFQEAPTELQQPSWRDTAYDIAKTAQATAPRAAAGVIMGGPGSVLSTATKDIPELARSGYLAGLKKLDIISPEEQETRAQVPLYQDEEVQKGYREPFTGAPTYKAVTETFPEMAIKAGVPSMMYKPQTGPGRVAQAGIETGIQAIPGGIATMPSRVAVGTMAGAGGQSLAEGVDPEAEPWARAIGTALGGVSGHFGAKGVGSVINSVRAIASPTGLAKQQLADALALDVSRGHAPMTYEQIMDARQRGIPLTIADIGGPEVRKLVESAGDISPETRQSIKRYNDFLNQLQESTGQRMQGAVDSAMNYPVNAPDIKSLVDQAGKAQRSNVFAIANQNPNAFSVNHGAFTDLLDRPIFKDAMDDAVKMAQNMPDFNIRPMSMQPGQTNLGNLNYWHQVKIELQEMAERYRESGNLQKSAAAMDAKNKLVGTLTKLVPEYRNALDAAAETFNASSAPEAGYKFFDTANSFRRADLTKAMSQFTPEQQELFAAGFAQKIKDMSGSGRLGTVANKFMNDSDFQTRALQVLGPNRFNQIKTSVAVENLIRKADELQFLKNNINQGTLLSGIKGGATAAALDALFGSQALQLSPELGQSLGWTALIGGGLTAVGRTAANFADRRIAQRIVPLALSRDPQNMDKIAKIAANNPRVWPLLNKMTANISAMITGLGKEPAEQPTQEQADGGRIGRATGGRIGNAMMKADSLIRAAETAKKNLGKQTEDMLELPDEHITKALAIAKAHI